MANWIRKLMPQQERLFPLFNEHASLVERAAERLRSVLDAGHMGGSPELDRFVDDGRDAAGKILHRIRRSFVTPFERSDIKEMTSSMQGLLEAMQSVARTHRHDADIPLGEFSELIVECAGELKAGVAWLEDCGEHVDELSRMRDSIAGARTRMLALREQALTCLLANAARGPKGTFAASHLLQRVGKLVERFDDVADHIDDLVLDRVEPRRCATSASVH